MSIEQEIFQKSRCDFETLTPFGFVKTNNGYSYKTPIMNGEFRAEVFISDKGEVSGKLFDTAYDDEYTNFRMEYAGGYVGVVRSEYEALLTNIREQCFTPKYYRTDTANALVDYIIENYGDYPSFEFKRHPEISAIRSHKTGEWYAFLLGGGVEQIYLKLPESRVKELIKKDGICRSTFMSEKRWIIIPLEQKLSFEEIISYLEEARYEETKTSHWLVPANPEYYDIIGEFEKTYTTIWKQKGKIYVGDIIYLYLAAPISSILFKCEVTENNIPYSYEDKNLKMYKVFKMKLIRKYMQGELTMDLLREHGITWIRGQRRLPESLVKEIEKRDINGN